MGYCSAYYPANQEGGLKGGNGNGEGCERLSLFLLGRAYTTTPSPHAVYPFSAKAQEKGALDYFIDFFFFLKILSKPKGLRA